MTKKHVLLMAALLFFAFVANAQTIVLKGESQPLLKVLESIEQQSGKSVAYNEGVIDVNATVLTRGGSMTLDDALKTVLSQVNADFSIQGKQIVIIKATPQRTQNFISGIVRDEDGMPLPGAFVLVEETGEGLIETGEGFWRVRFNNQEKVDYLVNEGKIKRWIPFPKTIG